MVILNFMNNTMAVYHKIGKNIDIPDRSIFQNYQAQLFVVIVTERFTF